MIGLLAAFEVEVRGFLADLSSVRSESDGEARFFSGTYKGCGEAVVGICGAGHNRAASTASVMIARFQPALILSVGVCGALRGPMRYSDLVIPQCIQAVSASLAVPGNGQKFLVDEPLHRSLVQACGRAGLQEHEGLLLSCDRVVRTAAEKEALSGIDGAVAVDMESAAIAGIAQQAGVRFGAVRVIMDEAGEDLSVDYESIVKGRAVPSASNVAVYLLGHPWHCAAFCRDVRRAFKAAAVLKHYFRACFKEGGWEKS